MDQPSSFESHDEEFAFEAEEGRDAHLAVVISAALEKGFLDDEQALQDFFVLCSSDGDTVKIAKGTKVEQVEAKLGQKSADDISSMTTHATKADALEAYYDLVGTSDAHADEAEISFEDNTTVTTVAEEVSRCVYDAVAPHLGTDGTLKTALYFHLPGSFVQTDLVFPKGTTLAALDQNFQQVAVASPKAVWSLLSPIQASPQEGQ